MQATGSISLLASLIPEKQRQMLQRMNWYGYQSHIDKRLRIYQDNWQSLLRSYIMSQLSNETVREFFQNSVGASYNPSEWDDRAAPKWPLPITINLFKRVVQDISLVYTTTANRTFSIEAESEGTALPELGAKPETISEDSERFAEIVGADYNNKMARVNQLVNLCNVVLVRPVPDENYDSGFRLDILTPDMFTPIQSINDPSRLIGVSYVIDLTDTPSTMNPTRKEILIYMGEDGEEPFEAEIVNGNYEKPEKKPYSFYYKGEKYLPFAVFRNDEPLLGEFINRTAGRDLYVGTFQTAYLLSLWIRAYKESSGKNIIISGASAGEVAPKTFNRDAMAVWILPFAKDAAMIEQIDHVRDLTGMWEALQKYMESVLTEYGISIDKFAATPQSGVSLKIQNESIIQIIKGQWPYYRRGETALANIIRKLNNSTQPSSIYRNIPDDYEFCIDFGPLPYEPEPLELMDTYSPLVDQGYYSKAQMMMMLNPDIKSEEEAQDQIIRNMQKNKELRTASASFSMPNTALLAGQTPPAPGIPAAQSPPLTQPPKTVFNLTETP